ncbi:helix-turn-helix domain-containing protein [Paenibacillus sp. 32O-W]|uniref:winged helix-turn-helix transcriptional regulator n=1 Tax=Paenibacillus sp. 32O-W TaxID=1695218 RepID=UPI0011A6BCB2|nr:MULTISPECIES: helix-turn-helix domain-containing protein [Paenibacillaceae]
MASENNPYRSDCPINYSLEMLGDSWSLLIIRDIIFAGKRTYGEFLTSDEGIARNILANRLQQLTCKGILEKKPHHTDNRKDLYVVTDKGLDLIPILLELSAWGAKHEPSTSHGQSWVAETNLDREQLVQRIRQSVLEGRSVFDSVGD